MAILALVVGLIAISFISIYVQNTKPKITLGIVEGHLQEIPNKDNAVSTQTAIEGKRVTPIAFKENLINSVTDMKAALEAYGGIEIMEERSDYIYAVATTGTMKFHDDLEIYFDEAEGVIHYRSASRAGYSDLGLNRSRYEDIKALYKVQ